MVRSLIRLRTKPHARSILRRPDEVTLRPKDAGTFIFTINAEPAFRIAIGEKTRWLS